jgi:hypothetical protein
MLSQLFSLQGAFLKASLLKGFPARKEAFPAYFLAGGLFDGHSFGSGASWLWGAFG